MNRTNIQTIVAKLKTNLFRNSNSYSVGMLKSHFKGMGIHFKEHQIYSYGDEIKFIDWKIFAKTNVPYVKRFEEERNVEIAVIIDASMTMFYGFNDISKLQVSIEICCLLYLLAEQSKDVVHAIIVADDIISVPRARGDEGIVRLITLLKRKGIIDIDGNVSRNYRSIKSVNQNEVSQIMMKEIGKNREVVVLSDFNDFLDVMNLKRILCRKNVHCFQVISPLDEAESLPYSIFTADHGDLEGRGRLSNVNLYKKDELKGTFGKNFKKLKVHDRYLEEFVKEML